ncbi:Alpha carbonic anhydrase domain-containing protein [Hirschfeldia incana]|nr:Alpha carbonic anhydrase domain-containing protein [Hirschfeldia incana]
METKNNQEVVLEKLKWLSIEKYHVVPPNSPGGGGLFLIWRKEINLTVRTSTKNFIDTVIEDKGKTYQVTFVYGEPDHTKRHLIWNELSALQTSTGNPWLLTGDFNELTDNSEKKGGPERAKGTFCSFRAFLSSNDLFDIKHYGNYLSWRGKRNTHLVQCRLDRSISNSEWFDTFPSCRCQYLKYEGSDHRPLLTFLDTRRKKGAKIFRFDRRLKDNPEVRKLVHKTWNEVLHLDVEAKLSQCRKAICNWSRAFHENSRKALENLRSQLDEAMSDPVSRDDLIHEINTKLLQAYKAEEEYWRQRSRQLWLTLGDSNTGYFHASTKARKSRNRLTVIEDDNGIPWFEEEKIAEVICKYFDKDESEFSYERNQDNGPEKWGKLKPEWKMCGKGEMQSPIDLLHKRVRIVSHLGGLTRDYKSANATLINRGHDMMVRFEEGPGSIKINNTEYQLHQLHWHSPSEHTINGRRFALELHMVHESANGSLAVVTVLYKIGRPDSFLSLLENKLCAVTDHHKAEVNIGMIDPKDIKLGSRKYYRYIGSLTIPPCTQNVIWTVIKKVRTVARHQVKLLRVAVHDYSDTNARPVQPTNMRTVKLYKPKSS